MNAITACLSFMKATISLQRLCALETETVFQVDKIIMDGHLVMLL